MRNYGNSDQPYISTRETHFIWSCVLLIVGKTWLWFTRWRRTGRVQHIRILICIDDKRHLHQHGTRNAMISPARVKSARQVYEVLITKENVATDSVMRLWATSDFYFCLTQLCFPLTKGKWTCAHQSCSLHVKTSLSKALNQIPPTANGSVCMCDHVKVLNKQVGACKTVFALAWVWSTWSGQADWTTSIDIKRC